MEVKRTPNDRGSEKERRRNERKGSKQGIKV